MRHLGDITKIDGSKIEKVDAVTFGAPCFPEGTLVLTQKGYESIENIRVGDIVYTHKGNWKPVEAVGYSYSNTIKLQGNHYGVVTTPNHPFLSAEQKGVWNGHGYTRTLENAGEWTAATDMQGKRWAVPYKFDGLEISPIEKQNGRQNIPPKMSPELMYIVGRWLGDGWLRHGQRKDRPQGQEYGQIIVCASKEEAPILEEKLMFFFAGVATLSKSVERTVVKFRVNHQPLCKWLIDNFGEKAHGKTLPAWALCMSEDMRAALLEGYLDSDGYQFKESSWKATTVSKNLAHSMRLLGETLGFSCTVHFAPTKEKTTIEGRTVNQRPQYQVVFCAEERTTQLKDENFAWYKVKSVKHQSENEKVYNITVKDDHSYIVEGFVVHNCQDISVANRNRAGMKHEKRGDDETTRSGLFFDAVRVIKEMRESDRADGRTDEFIRPRYAVYENVPGALSSNGGQDFAAVLTELIKIAEPQAPDVPVPKNGWPKSGCLYDEMGRWSIAFRIHDAQFWGASVYSDDGILLQQGTPQRRRRIAVVADFGGTSAPEILFVRKGTTGDFETSDE